MLLGLKSPVLRRVVKARKELHVCTASSLCKGWTLWLVPYSLWFWDACHEGVLEVTILVRPQFGSGGWASIVTAVVMGGHYDSPPCVHCSLIKFFNLWLQLSKLSDIVARIQFTAAWIIWQFTICSICHFMLYYLCCHALYRHGKGVDLMQYMLSLLVTIAGGVACHYIIKWLDRDNHDN